MSMLRTVTPLNSPTRGGVFTSSRPPSAMDARFDDEVYFISGKTDDYIFLFISITILIKFLPLTLFLAVAYFYMTANILCSYLMLWQFFYIFCQCI